MREEEVSFAEKLQEAQRKLQAHEDGLDAKRRERIGAASEKATEQMLLLQAEIAAQKAAYEKLGTFDLRDKGKLKLTISKLESSFEELVSQSKKLPQKVEADLAKETEDLKATVKQAEEDLVKYSTQQLEEERAAAIARDPQHGELLGDLYRAIDLAMRTAKKTSIKGQAEGNDFQVANKFAAVRKGLANFIKHPVDAFSAISAARQLDKKLQGDINEILANDTTKIILQDEGLFRVLGLQKERIKGFVQNNHDVLIFGIYDLVYNPSALTDASKKILLEQLLKNPQALPILIDILAELEEPLKDLCSTSEFKEKILKPLNLQDANMAPIISSVIKIAQQMPQQRELLARLLAQLPKIDFNKSENIADVLTLLQNKELLLQITNLITIDNLTALWPLMEKQVGNQAYLPLIAAIGQAVSNATPEIAAELDTSKDLLTKIIAKITDTTPEGISDNDLRGAELQQLAKITLSTLKKVKASDLITQHAPIIHGIIQEQYPNLPVPEAIAPIITESLAAFLNDGNLQKIETDLLPHLAAVVDNEGAKQMEAAFKVGDAMLAMLKEEPWPSIYKAQLQPLVQNHKAELGKFIDDFKTANPALSKFSKIKGEDIVALLAEPATLTHLAEMYENAKKQSAAGYMKAGFIGIKAVIESDKMRSVVLTALAVVILEGLRNVFIPAFIRRALIGDRMHQQMQECLQNDKKPIDMNAAFIAQENKPHDSILTYSLHNRACYDLDFKNLKFEQCQFNHFDFHNARFGSKEEGVNFANTKFRNTNFADVRLRGNVIDLTKTDFDLQSFKSLLPVLDKLAQKEGVQIKIEGMLVHGLNKKEVEKLQQEKSPFWEKYADAYLQDKPNVAKQLGEASVAQSPTL